MQISMFYPLHFLLVRVIGSESETFLSSKDKHNKQIVVIGEAEITKRKESTSEYMYIMYQCWVSRDQSRDRQSMISILFLISKVLVLILILISELLISEFSLEISSRSTLLLCKISYEKAFKIVHQSAKT